MVSDGSSDSTAEVVRGIRDPRLRFHETSANIGKTAAQNEGLELVEGQVVVFTDADSSFGPEFLDVVKQGFLDARVGLVDCQVLFQQGDGKISENQSRYWRFEQSIRRIESDLGILAVASGAGLSIRRDLIQPMRDDVGEDCLLPLQVVEQGFLVRHMKEAQVVDRMPDSTEGELRARARMTARNIRGTLPHRRLLNPLAHPGIAFALWSHKLLRWLSPLWVTSLVGSGLAIVGLMFGWEVAVAFCGLLITVTWCSIRTLRASRPLPGLSFLGTFSLANLGFRDGYRKINQGYGASVQESTVSHGPISGKQGDQVNSDQPDVFNLADWLRRRMLRLVIFGIVGAMVGAGLFGVRQRGASLGVMTATVSRSLWIPYFNFGLAPKPFEPAAFDIEPIDQVFFERGGLADFAAEIKPAISWNRVELSMAFDPANAEEAQAAFERAMELVWQKEQGDFDQARVMLADMIRRLESIDESIGGRLHGDVTDLFRFRMTLESLSPPMWLKPLVIDPRYGGGLRSQAMSLLLHVGVGVSIALAIFVVPAFFERPLVAQGADSVD